MTNRERFVTSSMRTYCDFFCKLWTCNYFHNLFKGNLKSRKSCQHKWWDIIQDWVVIHTHSAINHQLQNQQTVHTIFKNYTSIHLKGKTKILDKRIVFMQLNLHPHILLIQKTFTCKKDRDMFCIIKLNHFLLSNQIIQMIHHISLCHKSVISARRSRNRFYLSNPTK